MVKISNELEKKVSELYNSVNKVKDKKNKKIIYILTDIIVSKYKNLITVAKKNYISIDTLNELILDKNLMNNILTNSEYLVFLDVYNELIKKYENSLNKIIIKTTEEEKYDITFIIINDILHNYYNVNDICEKENIKYETFKKILDDKIFIDSNFGEGMHDKIHIKLAENIKYCKNKPQKSLCIKSEKYLSIVAPGIKIINEYEQKRLEYVSMYIESDGNIDYIMKKYAIENELPVISILISSDTKKLLNINTYEKLFPSFSAERILYNMDETVSLSDKKKLIDTVVLSLKDNDFNINLVSKELNLFTNLLKRVLSIGSISIFYPTDIKNIEKVLKK